MHFELDLWFIPGKHIVDFASAIDGFLVSLSLVGQICPIYLPADGSGSTG